jgi:tetratricopeptide (TPR) repeat protein
LGAVLKDLHDYPKAVEVFERAIAGRKATEGEQSQGYAMGKAMAAGAYRDMGDYVTADAYLRDAFLQNALAFNEENITAAAILNSWGLLYKKQRKFDRSLDSYQRSLNLREKLFGDDHPETISTRHNIGELYVEWGKPEQAQEMFELNVSHMEKLNKDEREANEEAGASIKNSNPFI